MNAPFVLLAMIFCHIIDDFNLQGIMCQLKQKSWWKENAPDAKYKYDYIMTLALHSFSWAFMVMLPIAIYQHFDIGIDFIIFLIANIIIHAIIDHIKANLLKINLTTDQLLHLMQIVITAIFFLIER